MEVITITIINREFACKYAIDDVVSITKDDNPNDNNYNTSWIHRMIVCGDEKQEVFDRLEKIGGKSIDFTNFKEGDRYVPYVVITDIKNQMFGL
ncbi:hypothetical protein GSF08_09715 [Clostridiaceae bacterium DONG20-135]|uniref:Uncharacterized protein n=1 Tax=Copranaerobaculum intestinale TaxID=2692629 RepID=A0A6N8U8G2_9FIRM|nr:hypothetical protein [Copranaerobaculum intestinale]MXQ74212.1 hypothetical protein [Copranaerobaculum intestinale]